MSPGAPTPGELVWVPGRVHRVDGPFVTVSVGGQLVTVDLGVIHNPGGGRPVDVETKVDAQAVARRDGSA